MGFFPDAKSPKTSALMGPDEKRKKKIKIQVKYKFLSHIIY